MAEQRWVLVTTLSRREALLVRELARTPGVRVTVWELADAIGETCEESAKYRVQATVQRVRAKFGAGAIHTDRGHGYYVKQEGSND